MTDATVEERPQPIAQAKTNTREGSVVEVMAEHPPLLFLHTETGEMIAVPVEERNTLIREIGRWNLLVATLHDANAQVQYFEQERGKAALLPATAMVVHDDGRTTTELEFAEKNWKTAIEWQEEVQDALRKEMQSLDKIGDSGKKLVELIPIPVKKKSQAKAKDESEGGKYADGQYSGSWKKKSWGRGKKRLPSKDWIRVPMDSMVYVPSDQLKKHWPKIKDPKEVQWHEVIAKDKNGKRKIDHAKLKAYAHASARKIKLQAKDYLDLELDDVSGSLGAWATAWNQDPSHHYHNSGKLTLGPMSGNIDVSAEAQMMRYLYGGGLNGTFQPLKGDVAFHAEGHAEFALAEAKAHGAVYFPSKEGWMWTLPASLVEEGAKAEDVDLGAIRLAVAMELAGVVGASIAAEGNLAIENKEGRLPVARGRRPAKRGKRRTRAVQVFGPKKNMKVAELDFKLNAFAGAKADAELKGAIEWRNPEHKDKAFVAFAATMPSIGGMAGIGVDGELSVQYTKGIFKIHAHAAVCIGVGAEGMISYEVNVHLLGEFIKWFFYQLYHANFKRLDYLADTAFDAVRDLTFMAISKGEAIEKQFGILQNDIVNTIRDIQMELAQAEARQHLAHHILNDPAALRYAPPETKGMLIYQLSRHSGVDWAKTGLGLGDSFLRSQKLAILHILQWSHTRADCDNVIQHISAHGTKGDSAANLGMLRRFFHSEAPGDLDLPGIESHHLKTFDDWYNSLITKLKKEPTRGYPVARSDTMAYQVQFDYSDHPLFSSLGDRAFYACTKY